MMRKTFPLEYLVIGIAEDEIRIMVSLLQRGSFSPLPQPVRKERRGNMVTVSDTTY